MIHCFPIHRLPGYSREVDRIANQLPNRFANVSTVDRTDTTPHESAHNIAHVCTHRVAHLYRIHSTNAIPNTVTESTDGMAN
jgi:hypothetical protein